MRYPFTLVKVKSKSGTIWHARFWDEEAQKYAHSRSTGIPVEGKKERRREAEEAAKKIYDETIVNINQPIKTTQQTQTGTAVANTLLVDYIRNFWTPNSEYADFKRNVEKKPLTPYYIQMNHDDVRRHVEPYQYFESVTVGSLNKAILKKWLIWLASRKTIRRKKDGTVIEGNTLSSRRVNTIIQSVRVAIRWAVDNEEIHIDPFHKLGEVTEEMKEKGVLTFEERNRLIELPITNHRTRLAMLIGSLCGLRRGEMRGLQWGDISDGLINIRHNYQDKEGLKLPKYNSVRKVPVPEAVQKLLDIIKEKTIETAKLNSTDKENPIEISPDSFIFESPINPGKPVSNNFFRDGVTNELINLGISETKQKDRFISCHSLRHTFVTLALLSGIPDVVVSALAGHKNVTVTKKDYNHVPQVIDFNDTRKKIEATTRFIPFRTEEIKQASA